VGRRTSDGSAHPARDILWLTKMRDFAKYGYPKDNPMDQAYKTGAQI
jgi:hypothetical protein